MQWVQRHGDTGQKMMAVQGITLTQGRETGENYLEAHSYQIASGLSDAWIRGMNVAVQGAVIPMDPPVNESHDSLIDANFRASLYTPSNRFAERKKIRLLTMARLKNV